MTREDHVDITPSPRVLRMLGQIDFAPWQCLAELIDNSIDAFIDQVSEGQPPINPKISISLPTEQQLKDRSGYVEVADNGRGMSVVQMSDAVRAGYSGNDPVEKMGLFGMGFNISTARLGRRTEVWTTTADSPDWTGIVIDFDELEKSAEFSAPVITKPKTEVEISNEDHGTRIRISRLEPDRIRALTRGAGKRKTMVRLGKIYGQIMHNMGIVLSFDGDRVHPKKHCVWDQKRSVDSARFGRIPAILPIEHELPSRRFCTTCWVWLADIDENCSACGHSNNVVERKRTLKGWLGIQRYFDKEHYGIDLIRNGRVIEELDKSLFSFVDEGGEKLFEYPVDATHWGGRIVGELEIDFVRVSHQKDSFDKLDPEWKRVVDIVRGQSPIQPQIAKRMSLMENTSPLARLFAGYRKGKAGLKDLVPGTADGRGLNSGPVLEYLDRFHAGETDFQSDDKWYDLVLQAERAKKGGTSSGAGDASGDFPIDEDDDDLADEDNSENNSDGTESPNGENQGLNSGGTEPRKRKDDRLSGPYELNFLPGNPAIFVEAYEHDQDLGGHAYTVQPEAYTFKFNYNGQAQLFEESLVQPVDCLLIDLAHHFLAVSQQSPREYPVSMIERKLRNEYFPENSTILSEAASSAGAILDSLKRHYVVQLPEMAPIDENLVPISQKDHIVRAAQRAESVSRPEAEAKIVDGTFVEYVSNEFIPDLVKLWPATVTNGNFFTTPVEAQEDPHTSFAFKELVDAMEDVVWLKEGGSSAINKDRAWRLRYAKSVASLRLIESWQV